MAINLKHKIFYWYRREQYQRCTAYIWNPLISYLRILLIIGGLVLCISNQLIMGVIVLIGYFILYFTYLYVNHDILLMINRKKQVKKISGNRYSLTHPLTILVRYDGSKRAVNMEQHITNN